MILECKSCQKKFIVPDNAITNAGRLVQCSSCGNKWTQFPIKKIPIKSKKIVKNNNNTMVVLAWNFFKDIKKNNESLSKNFINIKQLEN